MNSTFGPSVSGEELCNKQFRTKSRNGKFRLGHGVHLVPRKCIRDVSANSEKPCWPGLHSLGFPRFLRLEFLSPSPKADSNLCGAPSLHSAHLGLGSDLTLGFLAGLGTHVLCSVVQSCLTLCDPMDCSPPGSSVNGISQARILEWVAISFSRGIFLTQGLNVHLLQWWEDSSSLSHQGSPTVIVSVQFSCSVVSDSLQSHKLQHARPPCPSPTPGVYPNSCPLSW